MEEPLLQDYRAQERAAAAAALAGKLPGAAVSPPGERKVEDLELAALPAKNRVQPAKKSEEEPPLQVLPLSAKALADAAEEGATAAAAFAGKQHGSDPGAAVSLSDEKKADDQELGQEHRVDCGELGQEHRGDRGGDKKSRGDNSGEAKKSKGEASNTPVLPTPEEAQYAKRLAADARDLLDELRGSGSDLLDPCKEVASAAEAYADSRDNAEAATSLADALGQFNNLDAETKPKMSNELSNSMQKASAHGQEKPGHSVRGRIQLRHVLAEADAVLDSQPLQQPGFLDRVSPFLRREGHTASNSNLPEPTTSAASEKCSWIKGLRRAIFPPEERLPTHVAADEAQAKLVGKRQVLYVVALAAPVPLLTSAAGLQLFPGHWAWVAGAGVGVWIIASGGMIFNQYGQLEWEQLAPRHLGRLGLLGAALVFSFYAYRAYFPSEAWALGILIVIVFIGLGIPWMMSCIRGDEIVGEISTDADAGTGSGID